MKLIYVAHPFGGELNDLRRARRWWYWLVREFPENAYECSWFTSAELLDDGDPEVRALALDRCCEIAQRCDAVLLVGGHLTSGMEREAGVAPAVLDLLKLGVEPPKVGSHAWITTSEIGLVAGVLDAAFKPRGHR